MGEKVKHLNKMKKIKVIFEGEVDPDLNWEFDPLQNEVYIHPGETALMFYRAVNN